MEAPTVIRRPKRPKAVEDCLAFACDNRFALELQADGVSVYANQNMTITLYVKYLAAGSELKKKVKGTAYEDVEQGQCVVTFKGHNGGLKMGMSLCLSQCFFFAVMRVGTWCVMFSA